MHQSSEDILEVAPPIGKFKYSILELRYKLLVHPNNKNPSYYLIRHRYNDEDRYLLDTFGTAMTYIDWRNGERISLLRRFRYTYYFLKYSNDYLNEGQETRNMTYLLHKCKKTEF